jgi:hypothetical protein
LITQTAEHYPFLNQSGTYIAKGIDDAQDFKLLLSGLASVGVDTLQQEKLLALLASLLNLGAVQFTNEETSSGEKASLKDAAAETALAASAELLGVGGGDAEKGKALLQSVLCERTMKTMGEVITVQRNAVAATYARNAVAKDLYSKIFDWTLRTINVSLGGSTGAAAAAAAASGSAPPFIGVLDIFGFECFDHNDFEQLLINYTNEVLQATFNQQIFQGELELYRSEGIHVKPVQWPDNRECIELISNRQTGVLALLDAEARTPKPSDEKFNKSAHTQHGFNPFWIKPHAKDIVRQFIVRHYAGEVPYTVGNFVDKNNNNAPEDIGELFAKCSVVSALELIPAVVSKPEEAEGAGRKMTRKRSVRLDTVGGGFCKQMKTLKETLERTKSSFIRCLKPSDVKGGAVGAFDRVYTLQQLQSQGILQTCQVLRCGLPTRVHYKTIVADFRAQLSVSAPHVLKIFANEKDNHFVGAVLWAFEVPKDAYRLGHTRVFFRVGKMALLNKILQLDWEAKGAWVAARLLRFVQYRRWRTAFSKVRCYLAWLAVLERAKAKRGIAATHMQRLYRGRKGRMEAKRRRKEVKEAGRRKREEAERKEEAARRECALVEQEQLEAEGARVLAGEQRRKQEEESQRLAMEAEHAKASAATAAEKEAAAARAAQAAAAAAAAEARQKEAEQAEESTRRRYRASVLTVQEEHANVSKAQSEDEEAQRRRETRETEAMHKRLAKQGASGLDRDLRRRNSQGKPDTAEGRRRESIINERKKRLGSLWVDGVDNLLDGVDDELLQPEELLGGDSTVQQQMAMLGIPQGMIESIAEGDEDDEEGGEAGGDYEYKAFVTLQERRKEREKEAKAMSQDHGGTRRSMRPSVRSSVRRSLAGARRKSRMSRRSSAAGGGGISGTGTAGAGHSLRAQHLTRVKHLRQLELLSEQEGSMIERAILAAGADAPFPESILPPEAAGLDDEQVMAMLDALEWEAEQAALAAAEDDENEILDTNVDLDDLWKVAQMCCPSCSGMCASTSGASCTHCGFQLYGDPEGDGDHGGEGAGEAEEAEEELAAGALQSELDPATGFAWFIDDGDDENGHAQETPRWLPAIENLGGLLSIDVHGSVQQMDDETMAEFTEYIVTCRWGLLGRIDR